MSDLNETKSNFKKIIFLCFLIFSLFIGCFNSNHKNEINIFAAASLSGPLDKIKEGYKKSINIDYDGSFSLINKINLGASPDIIIIAGDRSVDLLDQNLNNFISTKRLIKNELVLIYKDKFGDSLSLNEVCANKSIAFGVADPLLAPLGKQSNLILKKHENCKKILENQNLIISSNAMTLISALSYGHLDGAIVYKSDYMNSIYNSNSFRISEDNLDKTIYYLVLIMGSMEDDKLSNKQAFVDYLFSNDSKKLFNEFGFEMVNDDF